MELDWNHSIKVFDPILHGLGTTYEQISKTTPHFAIEPLKLKLASKTLFRSCKCTMARLGPVAWFCNSSYLGGRKLELLRSLSPGNVLSDLSSVRNSAVSAVKLPKVQSEGQGKLWEGFDLLVWGACQSACVKQGKFSSWYLYCEWYHHTNFEIGFYAEL